MSIAASDIRSWQIRLAHIAESALACHACLALMTHRPIMDFSRTVSCKACASGRSRPCRGWRSVGRSVGGPREACIAGSDPPRHPSHRIFSVRGGSRQDARGTHQRVFGVTGKVLKYFIILIIDIHFIYDYNKRFDNFEPHGPKKAVLLSGAMSRRSKPT
jgi:hypothetical protein